MPHSDNRPFNQEDTAPQDEKTQERELAPIVCDVTDPLNLLLVCLVKTLKNLAICSILLQIALTHINGFFEYCMQCSHWWWFPFDI